MIGPSLQQVSGLVHTAGRGRHGARGFALDWIKLQPNGSAPRRLRPHVEPLVRLDLVRRGGRPSVLIDVSIHASASSATTRQKTVPVAGALTSACRCSTTGPTSPPSGSGAPGLRCAVLLARLQLQTAVGCPVIIPNRNRPPNESRMPRVRVRLTVGGPLSRLHEHVSRGSVVRRRWARLGNQFPRAAAMRRWRSWSILGRLSERDMCTFAARRACAGPRQKALSIPRHMPAVTASRCLAAGGSQRVSRGC